MQQKVLLQKDVYVNLNDKMVRVNIFVHFKQGEPFKPVLFTVECCGRVVLESSKPIQFEN